MSDRALVGLLCLACSVACIKRAQLVPRAERIRFVVGTDSSVVDPDCEPQVYEDTQELKIALEDHLEMRGFRIAEPNEPAHQLNVLLEFVDCQLGKDSYASVATVSSAGRLVAKIKNSHRFASMGAMASAIIDDVAARPPVLELAEQSPRTNAWTETSRDSPSPALRADRPVIAVFDVEDASGTLDAPAIEQLTEYLAARLTSEGSYAVVPRSQLRARLREEKADTLEPCYDEACQIELGKAVAASKTVATKLLRVGSDCAFAATLFDLRNETAERATTVDTACGTEGLLDAIAQVATRLSH